MMAPQKKRNAAVGRAKSLWNFTTSPRWSREETRNLELCLMKYGIGQWSTISSTGLLPGKVNGQLSGHTQRLLGQQSLEAFSGLCVDVEKIRKDNVARTDVMRKGGLIIHTGGKLSQEEKERRREMVQETYGLTEAKKREVDQEIAQLFARKEDCGSGEKPVEENEAEPDFESANLTHADLETMERPKKLELLQELRAELKRLYEQYSSTPHRPQKERRKRVTQVKTELPKERKKLKREGKGARLQAVTEQETTLEVDPVAADAIMEMGYSKRHAVDALTEHDNDVQAAVQWLILNCH